MEVVILFLMLASVITSTLNGVLKDSKAKLSSYWIHDLRFWLLCLLNKWKEKQLSKISIILWLGENSGFKGLKEGKTLLYQLSISTMWSLICSHYRLVKELSNKACCIDGRFGLASMREHRMWFARRECIWSCNLSLSFCKWRLMEINLVIASMLNEEEVLNASSIHMATLLCNFPSIFSKYNNVAL